MPRLKAQWLDTNIVHYKDTTHFDIWERQMNFDVYAVGYHFNKVVAYNVWRHESVIAFDLHFNAPTDAPIRIQAKVKFRDGTWVRTDIFENFKAGEQKYTFYFDTKENGSWGKVPQLPMFLWVETCQTGPTCMPQIPGLADESNTNNKNQPDFRVIKKEDIEKEGINPDEIKELPPPDGN